MHKRGTYDRKVVEEQSEKEMSCRIIYPRPNGVELRRGEREQGMRCQGATPGL